MSETMRRVRLEKESAKKNCPARRSQPSGRRQPCRRGLIVGNAIRVEGRRGVLVVQAGIGLRSIKQWPKLPVVAMRSRVTNRCAIYAEAGRLMSVNTVSAA